MLSENKYKIVYYYLAGAFALLLFVKFLASDFFKAIVDFALTFLPFIILIGVIISAIVKYEKNPELKDAIRKKALLEAFYLLIITLLFYVLYSPKSFLPIVESFKKFGKLFSLENYFIILAYICVAVISFSLLIFFLRVYQKSKGTYAGSIHGLFQKNLYSVFFIFSFLFISSFVTYPQAYAPITDFFSNIFYVFISGGNNGSNPEAMANGQRIASVKSALSNTYQNLKESISGSNKKLSITVAETKETLDNAISRTNKDLKKTLSQDIEDRLDVTGGTLAGDLIVEDDLTVEGTTYSMDTIPDADDSYDLGSVSKGWDNVYVHSLHGSSILAIGDGSTSHSLSDTDDLLVSGDLEANGKSYFDDEAVFGGAATFSGAIALNGAATFAGAINAGGAVISNLADPINPQDAVTKAYYLANTPTGVFSRVGTTLSPTTAGDTLDMGSGAIIGGALTLSGVISATSTSAHTIGSVAITGGAVANVTTLGMSGVLSGATTINTATISGGTLSGGSLSSTAVNGLSVSSGVISSGTWNGTDIGTSYIDSSVMIEGENISLLNNNSGFITSSSADTLTGKTWNGNAIGVAYGGTGLSSYSANSLIYASGTTTLAGLSSVANSFLTTDGSGVLGYTLKTADTFTQYALLAGRSGGQSLTGGIAATDDLTFITTSATATSGADMLFQTGSNGLTEAMKIDYSGITYVNALQSGAQSFENDAGVVQWTDLPVSSAATGTVESYSAMIDGNALLTVYAKSASSGTAISDSGVGIGTLATAPVAMLDVRQSGVKTAADYGLYVANTSTNATTDAINKYGSYISSTGTFTGSTGTATNNYGIYLATTAGADTNIDILTGSGASLTTSGIWTNAPSYKRYKSKDGDTSEYLDKLMELDVDEWQYKNEEIDGMNRYKDDPYRHASPYLDEFYKTFELGTDKGFNIQDLAGVSLASVKELNSRFIDKNNQIDEEITSIDAQISGINSQLTTNNSTLTNLESVVAELQTDIAELQAGLQDKIALGVDGYMENTLGITLEDGEIKIANNVDVAGEVSATNLTAEEKISAEKAAVQALEMKNEKGDVYCVRIVGEKLEETKGGCVETASEEPIEPTPPVDPAAPVITDPIPTE